MTRFIIPYCFALAMVVACPAQADVTYSKAPEGDNQVEVVRMTVTPAAEPVPDMEIPTFIRRQMD